MKLDYPQPIDGLRLDLESISPQLCSLYFASHECPHPARATYQIGIEGNDLAVIESFALGIFIQRTRSFVRTDGWAEKGPIDCGQSTNPTTSTTK